MRSRRGTEEEELKRKIRSLLEERKTYEEIEQETGASRAFIAKVKKQMEREEVGHRSPSESNPSALKDQSEEEGATKQLEAIDKATRNTALNEVIAKVREKAKLEVDDIYRLGLVLKDVLQGEGAEEYYKAAKESGLPLHEWIRQTLEKGLWYRYYFTYSIWRHPDLYEVVN